MLCYSILIPVLAAFGSLLIKPKTAASFFTITSSFLCLLNTIIEFNTYTDLTPEIEFFIINKIPIIIKPDKMGTYFALLVSLLYIPASIYTIGYLKYNKQQNQNKFLFYMNMSIANTIAIALSGNLITIFLFYELLTLTTYPLITHSQNKESIKSGRLYILHLLGLSLFLLFPAIILTFNINSSFDFQPININHSTQIVLFIMYFYGIAKLALFPFSQWLPAAMVAPAPVSALLHAVAVVKSGSFMLMKISYYVFTSVEVKESLIYVSCFTIITSSIMALKTHSIKKRLAYSTVNQIACICLIISFSSINALNAAFFLIISHAFSKITLFFIAGIISSRADITTTTKIAGIGKVMPCTMIIFTIASLALIGLPPTANFWAKTLLLESTKQLTCVLVLIFSSTTKAFYLLDIVYDAFFKESNSEIVLKKSSASSKAMLASSVITASAIIAIFLIWPITSHTSSIFIN